MIHFERRLGASWSTDQKPVGFVAFHLTLHPFRVQMRVSASAMLIPGHYLKRLKPISHPYGDVLLAKYRACARGHVLELQRVTNHSVSQGGWNATSTTNPPARLWAGSLSVMLHTNAPQSLTPLPAASASLLFVLVFVCVP